MCNMSLIFILQRFKPAEAIRAGLAVFLIVCVFDKCLRAYRCDVRVYQAAKGVDNCYGPFINFLESIGNLLARLDVYTRTPPASAIDEILVKVVVEILSTLALATKELQQGWPSKTILAGVLCYSVQRREIYKESFWRQGRRGGPTKARSTHP
jgi:hypothetical protein